MHASASLTEELQALQALQALILQEQTTLVQGLADQLPALISAKSILVAQIATLADARHQRLALAGWEASERGMQQAIDDLDDSDVTLLWNQLLALAATVKENNRLNGMLISKQMLHNQNTLNIFSGKVGGNFYGPDGQSSVKATSRTFGAV